MRAETREWIEKAEGDFGTAEREFRVRKKPNLDAVCFHAQQSAEKYLKAVLSVEGSEIPKTHDLEILLGLCLKAFPLWEAMRPEAQLLTQFSVGFRYPGEAASRESAKKARDALRKFRAEIRESLGWSLIC
jgi:HEPN domain-containing protein